MRALITFGLLAQAFLLSAQNTKGVKPTVGSAAKDDATTRAVIIGISNYQAIEDLKYADRDAMAFYNFLVSDAGGNVDSSAIRILLNEKAAAGGISEAFNWLMDESKPDDRAIIYFSGHGDVETRTQVGFLLAWDSPKNVYTAGGTIMFYYMQTVINTLSAKNVRVEFIADACRSGKLAGGPESAAQIGAALTQQWAKEIKILSCQAGELSQEGEQWGGGRGVFSYHFIRGLQGLADNNKNGEVTLSEMQIHLNLTVPAESASFPQNPLVTGQMQTVLSHVDTPSLLALLAEKEGSETLLAAFNSKAVADELLRNLNPGVQQQYRLFEKYLAEGKSLDTAGNEDAYHVYLTFLGDKTDEQLTKLMKRNLAAVFQNEAQVVINDYITGKLDIPEHRERGYFMDAANKLRKTIELVGETHPMANQFKSWKLFLEARAVIYSKDENEIQDAIIKLYQSLALDTLAAYSYNALGLIHYVKYSDYPKAVEFYSKAVSLAPKWNFAIDNLGSAYLEMGQYDRAIEYKKAAIALNPDHPDAYLSLAHAYHYREEYDTALTYYEKAISMNPAHPAPYCDAAVLYNEFKDYEKAIAYSKKAIELNLQQAYWNSAYYEIARGYAMLNDKSNALNYLTMALESGFRDFAFLKDDNYLNTIRTLPEFKTLMRKYFPEQNKE